MLYREPKLLKSNNSTRTARSKFVSVLYREPKLLKSVWLPIYDEVVLVSVLYREPKLLKYITAVPDTGQTVGFSALP